MQLPFDLEKAEKVLAEADGEMAKAIEQYGSPTLTLETMESPFAALYRSILFQQLSTRSATAIFNRVKALYKNDTPAPKQTLEIADEVFRGAGLSRQKIKYVRDLALKTIEGTVPPLSELEKCTDDEIVERLTAVHGIGRWTVEMLLIFSMGRPDVLPVTDLAIRKGFQALYKTPDLPAPRDITRYGEKWRPYRSIASWYLWRVVDGDNDAW